MSKLTIRPASEKELETIELLAWEIWPVYYQSIISLDQVEYMLREFGNPGYMARQTQNGMRPYLAFEDNKPVGYLALFPVKGTKMKLDKLYLLPETRGRNFGRQLLEFGEQEARKSKFNVLTLNVNRFNPSLMFYQKCGFHIVQQVDIPLGPFALFDFILEKQL